MSSRPDASREDLSALAWVHEELRRSLEAAHKSLRRFAKDTEALGESDIDAVDPAVLRGARVQIHQGVGALELVGQPAAALVLRASEALVQRCVAKPHRLTPALIDEVERASFALLDYLARLLAGKQVSALALFPQYRAVQEAAGAERVHPADLWSADWQWRDLPADPSVAALPHDAASQSAFESQLLPLMRAVDPTPTAERLSELCAGLGASATGLQLATLWKLASAVFEAQARGLLGFDVFSKRVASRLLAQYRMTVRGEADVSERLAQDLLFFCAQSASPGDGRAAPRLAGVRQAYGLAHHVPVDYGISVLGRFDPAMLVQAKKRVVAAKDAWSAVAGGEMHRLTGLSEQFALVGESLKRLFPLGERFAAELQHAIAQTQQSGGAPPPALAMEVATSLLYVEAALDDGDFDHPEQADRVQRLAERLASVRQGRAPEALEPWMEELYRRVSDRQTMGSVVHELRASLSEAEKLIDQYFRKPEEAQVLIPVPGQLSAMRGVLSVLGMDHASAALLRMRDDVDSLAATAITTTATSTTDAPATGHAAVFDRLAGNLGALGFLIDMLSVQPQMAKSLFTFDGDSGVLSPLMGRVTLRAPQTAAAPAPAPVDQRLIEQAQLLSITSAREEVPVAEVARDLELLSQEALAADQPALAATVAKAQQALHQADDARDEAAVRVVLSEALADFVSTASDPVGLDPETGVSPARPGRVSAPMRLDFVPSTSADTLAQDDEMREVFLEEAREVLADATRAHAELVAEPAGFEPLTTLRRAFHTLKGSSRMVGLKAFGEAAWACEQRYNTQLADQGSAPPALLEFTGWSLGYLAGWIDDIAARRRSAHDAATVIKAAERVDPDHRASARDSAPAPLLLPPDLPAADELQLAAPAPVEPPALWTETAIFPPSPPMDAHDEVAPAHAPLPEPLPVLSIAVLAPTEPMPLPEIAELTALEAADSGIDLALDFDPAATDAGLAPADGPADEPNEPGKPVEPEDEGVKVVGPLRIGIPLFNIYLSEADELSRRLSTEAAEWAMELERPIGEAQIALAHSLAGSSATVGFAELSQLARSLEHAQARSLAIGLGTAEEAQLFVDVADEIRHLLHQFAAGFLKAPAPELLARLAAHELSSARRLAEAEAAAETAQVAAQVAAPAPAPVPASSPPHEPEPVAAQPPVPVRPAVAPDSTYGNLDTDFNDFGLAELEPLGGLPATPARTTPASSHTLVDDDEEIDAVDAIDAELFPIFQEEAAELLPQLASRLRDWALRPADPSNPAACMRTLHTLKGGARLAGAMRLGELAHRLESRIESLLAREAIHAADIEALQAHGDTLLQTFEALAVAEPLAAEPAAPTTDTPPALSAPRAAGATALPAATIASRSAPEPLFATPLETLLDVAPPVAGDSGWQALPDVAPAASTGPVPPDTGAAGFDDSAATLKADVQALSEAMRSEPLPGTPKAATEMPGVDWARFPASGAALPRAAERSTATQSSVRVRAPLLDRLVNQAGEVSITRSRIEGGVVQIKTSLADLTENLERLRAQLRDIEFHGEVQMTSRLEAAKAASQSFDPLEFDRFTRFQELTRMMAESVNDVATVQRSLQRSLEGTEDELVSQARMTRDLQDDLLRTRMVEFEGLSDRLYRVVRQAAKETGKSVRLDIVGGSIEVDRGVLDRMTGAFEHLLRNSVTHGVETPEVRTRAGKDATGTVIVAVTQEGNEIGVEFRDDGAGLNLARIREKGRALGLLAPNAEPSDAELAHLIFASGFSTAETVTELAGRGIGMDVVRADVAAIGGRVATATAAGQGTSFRLILPLTTAVTQVVMLRCGTTQVAVPSTLVEIVRRVTPADLDTAYASGAYATDERPMPFFWLGALLQISARPSASEQRARSVVVIRSAQQRIALHVDEVLGNQEVVVKNLGPQLSRLPGLAGITLLASGMVALIYNPVALAALFGDAAREATRAALLAPAAPQAPLASAAAPVAEAPLVMVVDDSLTVRRVTQRLLLREGYRVVLAKDGLDALEKLAEALPHVVLSDIEMPRMDGFDLVRNMRGDARMRGLPVIMITSRIAQKHRDYAAELGVDHYLGKPYSEEDLLALIGSYTKERAGNVAQRSAFTTL